MYVMNTKQNIYMHSISSIDIQVWTRIFHVRPHSIGETRFLFVKNNFCLFYFYFKGKIKQERKNPKM